MVGVDGAGKSTVIEALHQLGSFRVIYAGGRQFVWQAMYDRLIGCSWGTTALAHLLIYGENLWRYLHSVRYRARGSCVIFDRYPAIEYKICPSLPIRLVYFVLYRLFFPDPDLVVAIVGEAGEIYRRKQEMTMAMIGSEQARLMALPKVVVVNNHDGELVETVMHVLRAIQEVRIGRARSRCRSSFGKRK